eukprot:1143075-Pelagomonas_calceolata.AAC.4
MQGEILLPTQFFFSFSLRLLGKRDTLAPKSRESATPRRPEKASGGGLLEQPAPEPGCEKFFY